MPWSDGRLKFMFLRVKAPCEPGNYIGDRYSIAYLSQSCKDALIQGPLEKYPMVTGGSVYRECDGEELCCVAEEVGNGRGGILAMSSVSHEGHLGTSG